MYTLSYAVGSVFLVSIWMTKFCKLKQSDQCLACAVDEENVISRFTKSVDPYQRDALGVF